MKKVFPRCLIQGLGIGAYFQANTFAMPFRLPAHRPFPFSLLLPSFSFPKRPLCWVLTLLLLTSPAMAQQLVPALPDSAATATVQDYSARMELAYATLSHINRSARQNFDPGPLQESLPDLEKTLAAIRTGLEQKGVINIKQLQMSRFLLDDMRAELTGWRASLDTAQRQLVAMRGQLRGLKLPAAQLSLPDSAAAQVLRQAGANLQGKRQRAEKLLTEKLLLVHQLQTRVVTSDIQTLDLQDLVDRQTRRFKRQSQGPEYGYLWAPVPDSVAQTPTRTRLIPSEASQTIIAYYFAQNWDNWAIMALVGAVFFGWVRYNFRRVQRAGHEALDGEQPFHYLRPVPVWATLVVVLSLAPALELHPPPVYLDVLQLLLLVSLTGLFWRSRAEKSFHYWLGIFLFFVILSVTNAINSPGLPMRLWLLSLNLLAAGLGVLFLRRGQWLNMSRSVVLVCYVFVGLNVLAVLANVLGRLSLARLLSTTAIFGLTQIIGLSVFVNLITEAFHLQMQASRLAGGASGAGFNYEKIEASLGKLLSVAVALLWLMVLASNLNLYTWLYGQLGQLLAAPRLIGSTRFTLGNIGLFFFIIYASTQLQKYVGYFFGEVHDDASPDYNRRGSWLVGLRLVLIVVGFLLAVAASGLPLDRIAIVFGALSVGIGLGLQGVVNNLVSGIILIFERPFLVGDFIEVAGKSGRVMDIGIRSSKLTSLSGSEIIVPNGDLLSGHVINWTRTNNHMRVELILKLAPGTDLETARALIQEEVKSSPNTLPNLPAEILLSSIAGQVYELKVMFWIVNIRQQEATKSEILAGINERFTERGILLS